MHPRHRFGCPSSGLKLSGLARPGRGGLWGFVLTAVAVHVLLTRVGAARPNLPISRPLTTQFVKRAPRLTKPLELKKQPRPKRRQMERKMVVTRARADRRAPASAMGTQGIVSRLAVPRADLGRAPVLQLPQPEPEVLAQAIAGTRQDGDAVDMSLELLDMDALDTGKYHAMVIQDPTDRRNIQGYFHLALTYSMSLLGGKQILYANWDPRYTRHLTNLCDAMNQYTRIRTDLRGIFPYDAREILSVPWVYASAFTSFEITVSEAENLGFYLLHGGFFFADAVPVGVNIDPRNAIPMDRSLRRLYRKSLGAQQCVYERDWDFDRLPNSHALYHCFFDFEDGPPIAGDLWYGVSGLAPSPYDYLEGITIEGRLVGVLSNKFYQDAWGHQFLWKDRDPSRALQFGVNTVVFALTQEGSITHRVMDAVSQ